MPVNFGSYAAFLFPKSSTFDVVAPAAGPKVKLTGQYSASLSEAGKPAPKSNEGAYARFLDGPPIDLLTLVVEGFHHSAAPRSSASRTVLGRKLRSWVARPGKPARTSALSGRESPVHAERT